jgi:hypothetical protein
MLILNFRIFNNDKPIELYPQVSFFQAPILDIMKIIINIMDKNPPKHSVGMILSEFFPFINPMYLPINLKNILKPKPLIE